MEWNFREDLPIYSQMVEGMTRAIVSGAFAPGDRLPAVRELALDAGVNPNTVQRALSELERSGLVYSQRTAGRFVTEDRAVIARARELMAQGKIDAFLSEMDGLGFTREQVVDLLSAQPKKEN
jgi:DNA-binding transcriptional regulator YhcF (GntR family)